MMTDRMGCMLLFVCFVWIVCFCKKFSFESESILFAMVSRARVCVYSAVFTFFVWAAFGNILNFD